LQFTTNAEKRKVILDQKGLLSSDEAVSAPRPDVPFLVISLTVSDIQVGTDDQWVDGSGNKQFSGIRRGTASFHGYGLETEGWLNILTLRYTESRDPLSLRPIQGGITPMHAVVDGDYREARYLKEFEIGYGIDSDDDYPVDVAASVEHTQTTDSQTDVIVEDL